MTQKNKSMFLIIILVIIAVIALIALNKNKQVETELQNQIDMGLNDTTIIDTTESINNSLDDINVDNLNDGDLDVINQELENL